MVRTSPYGMRAGKMHHGVDFYAPMGDPVRAVLGGTVTHATVNGAPHFSDYGRTVVIRHDAPRVWTAYAHLLDSTVQPGQRVERGQVIGYVGTTRGHYDYKLQRSVPTLFRGSKPHVHFEVRTAALPGLAGPHNLEPSAWLAAHALSHPVAPAITAPPGAPHFVTAPPAVAHFAPAPASSSGAGAAIVALGVGLGLAVVLSRRT